MKASERVSKRIEPIICECCREEAEVVKTIVCCKECFDKIEKEK